jgi:hypothetical protein
LASHDACKCDALRPIVQKKPPTVETEAGLRKSTLRIAVKNARLDAAKKPRNCYANMNPTSTND